MCEIDFSYDSNLCKESYKLVNDILDSMPNYEWYEKAIQVMKVTSKEQIIEDAFENLIYIIMKHIFYPYRQSARQFRRYSLKHAFFTTASSSSGHCIIESEVERLMRCDESCRMLNIKCWEELNSGLYSQISEEWRRLFSVSCLFLITVKLQFLMRCVLPSPHPHTHTHKHTPTHKLSCIPTLLRHVLRLCDLSLLMGAPIFPFCERMRIPFEARLASKLNRFLCSRIHPDVTSSSGDSGGKSAQTFDSSSSSSSLSSSSPSKSPKRKKSRNLPLVASSSSSAALDRQFRSLEFRAFPGETIRELPIIREPPTLEQFIHILKRGEPVILHRLMTQWRAAQLWKRPEYLRELVAFRTVPVEIGASYSGSDWSQKLMLFGEFLRVNQLPRPASLSSTTSSSSLHNKNPQPKQYLAQHQLFRQIPELLDDFEIPDYCAIRLTDKQSQQHNSDDNGDIDKDVEMNIWLGPAETVSPLHHDLKTNLLAQVFGSKYVRLYPASQSHALYPIEGSMLANTSQVDVVAPDLKEFPDFAGAHGWHGHLRAGQMLFIPPGCWHYVRSLSPSCSINFWWNC